MKLTPEQIMEVGERIYNVERLFNIREGATRKDDWLPDRYFDEPTKLGLPVARNKSIDRDKFKKMIDEYYQLHEWDEAGVPTHKFLKRLEISDLWPTQKKKK